MEDKNQSEARFYDSGARPGQMLEKLRVLKYALKRIEYQADDMDESRIFLEKNYSKYAIMDVLSRYVKNKNEVCMKMGHYLADAEGSEQILDWIFKGLKENYKDYAFYYLLGLCLKNRNVNQAFLCMENAEYYGGIRKDMITFIEENEDAPLHILEIGCGYGATLAHIKAHWPKSVVKGVELSGDVAQIGRTLADICQGDIECMDLPYERGYFDYILFGDVLEHLKNPGQTLRRLKPFLKKNGRIIASIPNVMHMSVIVGLWKGTAAYQKSGILDETHLRFFTFKTALELFEKTGFQIEKTEGILDNGCQAEEEKLIEEILKLPGTAEKETFLLHSF